MRRETKRRILALAAGAATLAGGVQVFLMTYNPIEGWTPDILLFPEDTVYSKGYTDIGFKKIRVGTTKSELLQILGPPLEEWDRGKTVQYSYSRSPGDTHYRRRIIVLQDEKVIEVQSEYYID